MPETVKQGSTGAAVREAQYLLARDRYLVAADGIVGLQTWAVSLHAAGMELADQVGV